MSLEWTGLWSMLLCLTESAPAEIAKTQQSGCPYNGTDLLQAAIYACIKEITYAALDNKPKYFKFSVKILPDWLFWFALCLFKYRFLFNERNSYTKEKFSLMSLHISFLQMELNSDLIRTSGCFAWIWDPAILHSEVLGTIKLFGGKVGYFCSVHIKCFAIVLYRTSNVIFFHLYCSK